MSAMDSGVEQITTNNRKSFSTKINLLLFFSPLFGDFQLF